MNLSGASTNTRISIAKTNADYALNGLSVDMLPYGLSALVVSRNTTGVKLCLNGSNTLNTKSVLMSIQVNPNASLQISGGGLTGRFLWLAAALTIEDGELEVQAGSGRAAPG